MEQSRKTVPVPYTHRKGEKLVCDVCPVHCILAEGETGICRGRRVEEGRMLAVNYGRIVSFQVDPIEKKPLYHVEPGAPIASTGPNGCNMVCTWCQNCEISQFEVPTTYVPPESLAERAMAGGSIGLAYTYTEPFIWFETIRDTAPLVHQRGGINVLVTNGYVEEQPLEDLLPHVDAANVDLKFIDPALHARQTGGRLEVVQRTIRRLLEAGVHVELTHLLITGMADNEESLRGLVRWIASLSPEIPLHLSRYFPRNKYKEQATGESFMERAAKIASEHLRYVYLGNVAPGGWSDTVCPACGAVAVRRSGYRTDAAGLEGAACASCGEDLGFLRLKS